MSRPVAALAVIVLSVAGCEGDIATVRARFFPSDEDRQTVERWLLCEECTNGELDSVVAMGDRAVPILKEALDGPAEDRRENMRQQIEAMWRGMRDTTAVQLSRYLAHFDSNYVATYQSRAAIGLDSIGGSEATEALRKALENDVVYRRDVRRVLGRVLGVRLSSVVGDTQHAPLDSFVRVDPAVLVDSAPGTGLKDVTVRFYVDSGRGQVLPADTLTDANGRAAARWRLGPEPQDSINILRVVAAGRAVRFHARAHVPELRVVFDVQPHNAQAGQEIMPPVRIEVVDAWGDIQTQINRNVTVTEVRTGIPNVYSVVNGAAQLTGLSIPKPGTDFVLMAQVQGVEPALSDSFDIAP